MLRRVKNRKAQPPDPSSFHSPLSYRGEERRWWGKETGEKTSREKASTTTSPPASLAFGQWSEPTLETAWPALRAERGEVISVPLRGGNYLYSPPPFTFFHTPSVFPCSASDMEDGNRFEEVDDAFLEDWADIGEIKEERDCTFAKMYGPIRALFATDSIVLSKFEGCLDHMERLSFLLNMEVSWLKGADNVVPHCIHALTVKDSLHLCAPQQMEMNARKHSLNFLFHPFQLHSLLLCYINLISCTEMIFSDSTPTLWL